MERGLGMHYTMADGTRDRFITAYAQVTAAQARLTLRNAVTEIDRLIRTAWQEKLPEQRRSLARNFVGGIRWKPSSTVTRLDGRATTFPRASSTWPRGAWPRPRLPQPADGLVVRPFGLG